MFYFIRRWRSEKLEKKIKKILENHSKKEQILEHLIFGVDVVYTDMLPEGIPKIIREEYDYKFILNYDHMRGPQGVSRKLDEDTAIQKLIAAVAYNIDHPENYMKNRFPEKTESTKTKSIQETEITKEWMQSQREKMRELAPKKELYHSADERIEIGYFMTETEPRVRCLIYYDYEDDKFYVYNTGLDTLTEVAIDEFPIQYLEFDQKIYFLGKGNIMSTYAQFRPASCGYPEYYWRCDEAVVLSSGIEIKESPIWYGFEKISKSEKSLKEFIPPKEAYLWKRRMGRKMDDLRDPDQMKIDIEAILVDRSEDGYRTVELVFEYQKPGKIYVYHSFHDGGNMFYGAGAYENGRYLTQEEIEIWWESYVETQTRNVQNQNTKRILYEQLNDFWNALFNNMNARR